MRIIDKIRDNIVNWLRITPAPSTTISITEQYTFQNNAAKNNVWYRGDSYELQQLYRITGGSQKFWAAVPTPGMEIRKIHTGLPALIVNMLSAVVMTDFNGFDFGDNIAINELWDNIERDNKLYDVIDKAIKQTLVVGDGAFKISVDTDISEYPIIEFIPGEQVEYIINRGRITEIVFLSKYTVNSTQYVLHEHYGKGYISYNLYRNNTEILLDSLPETSGLDYTTFDGDYIMAVPLMFTRSAKWENRGQSIYDLKIDDFDAFDEAWSQWMDALRAGRSRTYIPDCYIPRNPNSGMTVPPNAFDNRFIACGTDMGEKADNKIMVEQPAIPHDSYLSTYVTALDLCLQGLISPSTLGIDVKKLDNAEAQREKEKATLYTRNNIIKALQKALPELADIAIKTYYTMLKQPIQEFEADVEWGEYANPSFESQVETVGKAKAQGIMSIERCVDELYGDTVSPEEKAEEVERLKAEQGITELAEPMLGGVLETTAPRK